MNETKSYLNLFKLNDFPNWTSLSMDMLVIWSPVLYQYYIAFRHQTIPFGGCIIESSSSSSSSSYIIYYSYIIIWQNNKLPVVKKNENKTIMN